MKRAVLRWLLTVILIFIICPCVMAQTVLDDGFTDTSKVNMNATSARVDTISNVVLLPQQSLASSISMFDNGIGYAVASKAGITMYELDDSTGQVVPNALYSCSWATDATGVSIRQDNLNVWAVTDNSLACYKYSGSGMNNDPALKVSGLVNVLSVAAYKSSDSALLLQREGNKAKITRYDAGATLNPSLVFNTNIQDPVSISMVNNSPDFRLFTSAASYYFMYDEAGGTYVEDPARIITGLANAVSAAGSDVGSSILTGTGLDYYMNNDSGGATRVDIYSPGSVTLPVAVSLKAGSFEQVFLDENGNAQWWSYDDAGGKMVRISSYERTGLALNKGYVHPSQYYSNSYNSAAPYDAVLLTVAEIKPAGTSIVYYVSSDGGGSYTAVTPGVWKLVPAGSSFVLKATLDTTDAQQTPMIQHVILEADEDLGLEGGISPNPAERGRNVTVSARAVRRTSGTPATLDSCSVRYPPETKANGDPALPGGQFSTNAAMAYNAGLGYWEYTFTVPDKTVDNYWSDDGVYQLRITGIRGATQKLLTLNLEISGHLFRRIIIRTIDL